MYVLNVKILHLFMQPWGVLRWNRRGAADPVRQRPTRGDIPFRHYNISDIHDR
jgi:hypothetical protein